MTKRQNEPDASPPDVHPSLQMDLGLSEMPACDATAEEGAHDRDAPGEWRSSRQEQYERLALENGLPIGRLVTVQLRGGRYLEGRLMLGSDVPSGTVRADAMLDLRIGGARFHASEIVTCVCFD